MLKLNFRKDEVLGGKSPFFMIGPFYTLNFDKKVLYGKVALSIIVRSTKNRYSNFLKKVLNFQKVSLKLRVLKTLKNSSDSHIKNMPIPQTEGYLQNPK